MYIKITLESHIFILKALGYVHHFSQFSGKKYNATKSYAMGAAITRVRVQIFDVNYEQLIKLFCMKYTPVIFYKSSQ